MAGASKSVKFSEGSRCGACACVDEEEGGAVAGASTDEGARGAKGGFGVTAGLGELWSLVLGSATSEVEPLDGAVSQVL